MATIWKLDKGGTIKTLAAWKMRGVRVNLVSQSPDTLEFEVPVADITAADPFAINDVLKLIRNDGADVTVFIGKVIDKGSSVSGSSQVIRYSVANLWRDYERLVFQQFWTYQGNPSPKSHVILNVNSTGQKQTVPAQITEAINYASTRTGIAATPALSLAAVDPPTDEQKDITVAEVIQKMIRWVPDSVVWIDYSTTPVTLHISQRSFGAGLPAVTVPMSKAGRTAQLEIKPRLDLQVPSVYLKYEISNTVNGQSLVQAVVDKFPAAAPDFELNALASTINLQGFTANVAQATITTALIDAENANASARIQWWQAKLPWLTDPNIFAISITPESPAADRASYPNELIAGQLADWMKRADNVQVVFREETVKARVSFNTSDGRGDQSDLPISFKVQSTNAPIGTNTFKSLQSLVAGEAQPVGLAQYLYNSLNPLQYEGSITLKAQDVPTTVAMGKVLNISGGKTEWATMNALIQGISWNIDTGEMTIRFGPPAHLGIDDIITLLQTNRVRRVYTNPATVGNSQSPSSTVDLGKTTPNNVAAANSGRYELLTVQKIDPAAPGVNKVRGEVAADAVNARLSVTNYNAPAGAAGGSPEIAVNAVIMRMLESVSGGPRINIDRILPDHPVYSVETHWQYTLADGRTYVQKSTAGDASSGSGGVATRVADVRPGRVIIGGDGGVSIGGHRWFDFNMEDLAGAGFSPTNLASGYIKARPLTVCVDGVPRTLYFLCSDPNFTGGTAPDPTG